MTQSSHLSTNLRRQPKQQRGKKRVEKILNAAAIVFDRLGYEAATTHTIAAEAGTAIGSLYQFFPDKAAIFKAMELRHLERVRQMWAEMELNEIVQLPLREMFQAIASAVSQLFEDSISRVVFLEFYRSRQIFQAIDDSLTQEAINFLSMLLVAKNKDLSVDKSNLLAEVCVHSSNAIIVAILTQSDSDRRQQLQQQMEDLLVSYLEPYVGDAETIDVMKVMKCIHCQSDRLSKNGRRRGKQCYLCKDCGKQFVEKLSE